MKTQFFSLSPLVRLNILSIFVGIAGGFGSLVFRLAIDFFFALFFIIPQEFLISAGLSQLTWLPFLVAPLFGGLIVGLLTSQVSKEVKGHGVPEVLESVALHNGRMNLRIPFIKIVASATTIGSGGSAGREGPIAQIGAGFASLIGQKLNLNPKELRILVVSGVAAGISATFNAPIGGSLFALEILMRGDGIFLFVPIIVASVVGTVVGQLFLGSNPAFTNFPPLEYHDPVLIPLFLVLGLICGIGAAFWIKFFYKFEDVFVDINHKHRIPDWIQPAIGGLFVGLILAITFVIAGNQWENYTTMGRIYAPMDAVFNGFLTKGSVSLVIIIILVLFLLKILATVLTLGSGGSGGVFAPTLFLGVMIGAIIGIIYSSVLNIAFIDIALFALLGMAAFFAGVSRAPLTAIIMTAEMTGDYFLSIPLMFVVIISLLVATRLEPDDIYVKKLIRRGVIFDTPSTDVLDGILVYQAMTPKEKLINVDLKTRLETVLDLVRTTKHEGFPVFNNDNQFIGIITLSDIQKALHENPRDWTVENVMNTKVETQNQSIICIDQNATLTHAVAIMEKKDVSRLPVIEKNTEGIPLLIGWLTHHDITRIYISEKAVSALEKSEEHIFSFKT